MTSHNDIVLFHYAFSPYARRITWYLALRGIDYAQCLQPPVLPREDLNALGVKYRRIPVLSIGRDIYCDTRIILEKLEQQFPDNPLGTPQPDQKAVEKLLEKWTIDGGVFQRAAQLIPPNLPLLNDSKFTKDREEYTGRSWEKSNILKQRPEALAAMREMFAFLESGLLADGREWILNTPKPSLADIEAIWPFHWLNELQALPPSLFSTSQYPLVFAWISRFSAAISAAKRSSSKPTTLKGADAIKQITQSDFVDKTSIVDEKDPLGLEKGQDIEVWPTDTGFKHREKGRLVALTEREVVLESQTKVGGKEVRIHCPRTGFRIQAVGEGEDGAKAKL